MKIRAILISALIVCCISAAFMYTRAAQSTNESKMIERAIQGKNTSQLIKALIGKMKDQLEVNDVTSLRLSKKWKTMQRM